MQTKLINQLHPAYLFIGSDDYLHQKSLSLVRSALCKTPQVCKQNNECCIDCIKIDKRAHHLLRWFQPENTYTVAQIEEIFELLSFSLSEEQHFFIVIERADLFNAACANSLLKSLEEPPAGYHFILLAPKYEGILPTIRSRCIIEQAMVKMDADMHVVTQSDSTSLHYLKFPLARFFTQFSPSHTQEFLKELDAVKHFEKDVPEFLDQVVAYWRLNLIHALQKKENAKPVRDTMKQYDIEQIGTIIDSIERARQVLPMPGSAKLFLKNLYISFLTTLAS